MDCPRRSAGQRGVDKKHGVQTMQPFQQFHRCSGTLFYPHARRNPAAQRPREQPSCAIIAAIRITETEDDGAACSFTNDFTHGMLSWCSFHARTTSSFRKCVAQEMHGS